MAKTHRIPRLLIVGLILFALFVLALPSVFWFRVEYYDICPNCARKREVQDWLVPFTSKVYYRYVLPQDTELTLALEEFELVDAHEHRWLKGHGYGPGERVTYGEGFNIAQSLTTPSVGKFVRLLQRYSDEDAMAYWFARMTHSDHSYVVRNVADQCVDRSYADATAFNEHLALVAREQIQIHHFRLNIDFDEPESRTPPRLLYERPSR